MKRGQTSLVGAAGKLSLGRDRKSQVEAKPEGHVFLPGWGAGPGGIGLQPVGVSDGRGQGVPMQPRCPRADEAAKGASSPVPPRLCKETWGSAQNRVA